METQINQLTSQITAIKKSTTNILISNLKNTFNAGPIGIAPVSTGEQSEGLPTGYGNEFVYCSGLITKRDKSIGSIVLISYRTGKIGIVSTSDGGETWSEWFIK